MAKFNEPINAEHIKERRLKLRLSQQELAKELGIGYSTVRKYEAMPINALPKPIAMALEGLEERIRSLPLGTQARRPSPGLGGRPYQAKKHGTRTAYFFALDGTPIENSFAGRMPYIGQYIWRYSSGQYRNDPGLWDYLYCRTESGYDGLDEYPKPKEEAPAWMRDLCATERWPLATDPVRLLCESDDDIVTT